MNKLAPPLNPLFAPVRQRLWPRILHWRFRLFQRHRHRQLVIEHIRSKPFIILPDVFNPTLFRSSVFFAEQCDKYIMPGAKVLDMGTGCGIGAIFAADKTNHITAIDINPEAVRCAQINALLNHAEHRIEVIQSDLFTAIEDERFDVILFNPPYFRGQPQDNYDYAWRSVDTVERFAQSLEDHLKPGGFALVILSTNGDSAQFLHTFEGCKLLTEPVAERNLINETLTVYKIHPEAR